MKFKPISDYRYWWPVTVKLPHPDPDKAGKTVDQKFKMQFQAIPQSEANALVDEINALPPEQRQKRQHAEMLRVCTDWNEDIVNEDDEPIAFSSEALAEFMEFSWFRIGLYRAFEQSLRGEGALSGN